MVIQVTKEPLACRVFLVTLVILARAVIPVIKDQLVPGHKALQVILDTLVFQDTLDIRGQRVQVRKELLVTPVILVYQVILVTKDQ